MANRMSSLPITQFCSAAGVLGRKHGSGRAAAMSTAFHALCAEEKGAELLFNRLTDEEKTEILTWNKPEDYTTTTGEVLKYADAVKEEVVGFTKELVSSVDESSKSDCIGHMDMCWVVDGPPHRRKTVYVGDIKKSEWSSPDGPNSLQMMAYGIGAVLKYKADAFCCGHWVVSESRWHWGQVWDWSGIDTARQVDVVLAASWNTDGEYSTGPHCRGCWDRLHCKEYLLPVSNPKSALAPMSKPGGITKDNAYQCLSNYKAAEDFLKAVKQNLQAWAERNGGIHDGAGKVWGPGSGRNGVRLDTKALEKDNPELVARYRREYTTAPVCRWRKEVKQ